MNSPKECPQCAGSNIDLQVVAWMSFSDGIPAGLNDAQGQEDMPNATAFCRDCQHEWK